MSTLVILLHGYTHDPASVDAVKDVISSVWKDAEILAPRMPMSMFSMAQPEWLTRDVVKLVDAAWAEKRYDRIVLVGHSLGALIARNVYLTACGGPTGSSADMPAEAPREWANAIERIVLLAAMNRGWRISHHLNLARAPLWVIGTWIGWLLRLLRGRWPLIMTIRRGAEFITNLRAHWILMNNRLGQAENPALVIQLLGSQDDLVAPDDNIDLASGRNFVYLDVPNSNHTTIIDVDPKLDASGAAAARRETLVAALSLSGDELRRRAIIPSDDPIQAPDLETTDVVFVIHGIRDEGYWTHKIARRVRALARTERPNTRWATETSSYGYFPMLSFLLPMARRRKVEWLMDEYTQALSRYPRARFHFVGHSNGTYLVARALELYQCCRFEHVVFAGTVVRRNYGWDRAIERGQVSEVLNFVATADWVVAFFPKFFELVRIQDLGGAGHDGFDSANPALRQIKYLRGGHGAGIQERMWDAIARFVVSGQGQLNLGDEVQGKLRNGLVRMLGYFPPLVWAAIAFGVFFAGRELHTGFHQSMGPAFAGAALTIYVWLVLQCLRKI